MNWLHQPLSDKARLLVMVLILVVAILAIRIVDWEAIDGKAGEVSP